jgi:hypothetical protein
VIIPPSAAAGEEPQVRIEVTAESVTRENTISLRIAYQKELNWSLTREAVLVAGKNSLITLDVINLGNAPISHRLSVSGPSGWDIEISGEKMLDLSPGESRRIDLSVTPSKSGSGSIDILILQAGEMDGASYSFEVHAASDPNRQIADEGDGALQTVITFVIILVIVATAFAGILGWRIMKDGKRGKQHFGRQGLPTPPHTDPVRLPPPPQRRSSVVSPSAIRARARKRPTGTGTPPPVKARTGTGTPPLPKQGTDSIPVPQAKRGTGLPPPPTTELNNLPPPSSTKAAAAAEAISEDLESDEQREESLVDTEDEESLGEPPVEAGSAGDESDAEASLELSTSPSESEVKTPPSIPTTTTPADPPAEESAVESSPEEEQSEHESDSGSDRHRCWVCLESLAEAPWRACPGCGARYHKSGSESCKVEELEGCRNCGKSPSDFIDGS